MARSAASTSSGPFGMPEVSDAFVARRECACDCRRLVTRRIVKHDERNVATPFEAAAAARASGAGMLVLTSGEDSPVMQDMQVREAKQAGLRDVVAGFGDVQAPLGLSSDAGRAVQAALAQLQLAEPAVAAATEHLVKLVLSFRSSTIQAVAMLPVMQ